jgi:HD-GYP domain-containing protein (c-di-GMP phosphodiesterase class II)
MIGDLPFAGSPLETGDPGMPLLFNCKELQSGMRLAEAFTWRGRVMLPGGKVLTDADIDVLQRKYPDISVRVSDPVLDGLVSFEDDSNDREQAVVARQKVATCVAQVQQRFASQMSLSGVNFTQVRSAAIDVMDHVAKNPVSAALLDLSIDPASPLSGHTGNVFYLSIVLGSAVRGYVMSERQRQTSCQNLAASIATNMLPLGLGAMFMDVGMFSLQHVFAPGYVLTDADRAAIREHPIKGADMLPDTLPAGTKMVVRSHHENFDGSGYPGGQTADSMHIFTRIVRICDAFVAGAAGSASKGAKSPAKVIWEMCRGPYRGCYDPVLLRVFMGLIQPFPIGAKIKLQDGRSAVVVQYNRTNPFQPTGVVAFDAAGARIPEKEITGPVTLGADRLQLGSFEGEDLSFVNELAQQAAPAPPARSAPSIRIFKTLMEAAYP